jgi:hypothetical protein
MKTLSLKLDDEIFEETEQLLEKINIPRNRYINEALVHYNRFQKNEMVANQLRLESEMVQNESLNVLKEFEKLDHYDSQKE